VPYKGSYTSARYGHKYTTLSCGNEGGGWKWVAYSILESTILVPKPSKLAKYEEHAIWFTIGNFIIVIQLSFENYGFVHVSTYGSRMS